MWTTDRQTTDVRRPVAASSSRPRLSQTSTHDRITSTDIFIHERTASVRLCGVARTTSILGFVGVQCFQVKPRRRLTMRQLAAWRRWSVDRSSTFIRLIRNFVYLSASVRMVVMACLMQHLLQSESWCWRSAWSHTTIINFTPMGAHLLLAYSDNVWCTKMPLF